MSGSGRSLRGFSSPSGGSSRHRLHRSPITGGKRLAVQVLTLQALTAPEKANIIVRGEFLEFLAFETHKFHPH